MPQSVLLFFLVSAEEIKLTKAKDIRTCLGFIEHGGVCCNISHHIQYLEFLYHIKKIHEPKSTSQSLLNKTIIIEYFTIIEAILDSLLCSLEVKTDSKTVPLEVKEYTKADDLLRLAKHYRIINQDIHSQIGQIKDTRNRIHIKRSKPGKKLEYHEYPDSLVKQREKIFKNFMVHLFERHNVDYSNFLWPWKAKT